MEELAFPKNFLWGAATAAHQIEGNNLYSDWWEWEQRGGGTEPSGKACDHYRLFEKDFALAQKLNQNCHRLSLEWARIEPAEGKWDEEALEHYRTVLESLRQKKMKTFVTLFHFTLPTWFARKGGFEKRSNLKYFYRYTKLVASRLGDLIDFWLTINEPSIYIGSSYLGGLWPPQKKNWFSALKVNFNLVAAHRNAYTLIHRIRPRAKAGMAMNISAYHAHGLFLGTFLAKLIKFVTTDSFYFFSRGYHDFLGVNYYFYHQLSWGDFFLFRKLKLKNIQQTIMRERSDLGWPIYPPGIYEVLTDLKKYRLPIYITENGIADAKDKLRAKFITNHLCWLHQAIKEGADVKGYLHWSLIDNFEWAFGFKPRFGLIEVDYRTQKRKIRPSALVYAKICRENDLRKTTNQK